MNKRLGIHRGRHCVGSRLLRACDDLGDQYYDGAVPIVDELIGKAGLRLGGCIIALPAARSNEANLLV